MEETKTSKPERMTAREFNRRLGDIYHDARKAVVTLLQEAYGMSDEEWAEACRGSSFSTLFDRDPEIERTADGFADLTGFLRDRLDGTKAGSRSSLRRKLRKTLGYSVP